MRYMIPIAVTSVIIIFTTVWCCCCRNSDVPQGPPVTQRKSRERVEEQEKDPVEPSTTQENEDKGDEQENPGEEEALKFNDGDKASYYSVKQKAWFPCTVFRSDGE